MGQALSHVLKVADVAHVVIGGGMSASWKLMERAYQTRLAADLIPVLRGKVRTTVSRAQDSAGMLGAARLAGNQL